MNKVVLISCSKSKLPAPAEARRFYTGGIFRLSVRYAEAQKLPWVVLSAKYGVLEPGDRVEPYSETLAQDKEAAVGKDKATKWASAVGAQLRDKFAGCSFVSLCSAPYEAALAGLEYESPMRGLRIGQRLAWLKSQCDAGGQEELWTR